MRGEYHVDSSGIPHWGYFDAALGRTVFPPIADPSQKGVHVKDYEPLTAKAKPRPLVTVRSLRANFRAIIRAGEARVVGNRHTARAIILPVPPSEWHRKQGMDKRMSATRALFEELMSILER